MIRLKRRRTLSDIHPSFTGARLRKKLTALLEARIASGDAIEYEGSIGDWKLTKDLLKQESIGKCAYCESDTEKVAHGDVEHFRPKSVYWWLALCVDKHVYACQICNQTYKSDHFPFKGTRLKPPRIPRALPTTAKALDRLLDRLCPDPVSVIDDQVIGLWATEDADLPHPYLEDPELLLGWAVSRVNKEVHVSEPAHAPARAKRAVRAVVEYFGLNRETLTRSRYLVLEDLEFALDIWENGTGAARAEAAQRIIEKCRSHQQYAGMQRYFARLRGFEL